MMLWRAHSEAYDAIAVQAHSQSPPLSQPQASKTHESNQYFIGTLFFKLRSEYDLEKLIWSEYEKYLRMTFGENFRFYH